VCVLCVRVDSAYCRRDERGKLRFKVSLRAAIFEIFENSAKKINHYFLIFFGAQN